MMIAQYFIKHGIKLCLSVTTRRTLYSTTKLKQIAAKEVEIDVPWGKISGKLWGAQDIQPILALHGWQDNCGSFDKLAPLLVDNAPVLAIDHPGHGWSSWLPPGIIYQELMYLSVIERLRRHFKWEKLKIIAHSMSAQIMFYYAALYPELVQFVVALDVFKIPSNITNKHRSLLIDSINMFFKLEEYTGPPITYTQDEIKERRMNKKYTLIPLNEEASEIIMIRGAKQVDNGRYVYNRDPRVKFVPYTTPFSHPEVQELSKYIMCPYIIVKAKDAQHFEDKRNFYDIVNIMQENNTDVHYIEVDGPHHFHITDAEKVAEAIKPFIKRYTLN
ncbi:hypothetical protein KM043_018277 [Ampulex compressa]|nr:hypothetical protein KM043_018277 [Ampulex compressa]